MLAWATPFTAWTSPYPTLFNNNNNNNIIIIIIIQLAQRNSVTAPWESPL
jgi:hypothetical protein